VVAGGYVLPGDVIVADDDGVVVVPQEQATAVAEAGTKRATAEATKREKLAAGVLGLDLYGLREQLADLGVQYVNADQQGNRQRRNHRDG
jgi:4-hydroxy-4-methyl-2-oxoglutarate aldolase